MSTESWWATAPREQFTAEAKKHLPQMETSTGAKVLKQITRDSQHDAQDRNDKKGGGAWGTRNQS